MLILEKILFHQNMQLPNLPKKRKHTEADITPLVFAWFEKNYPKSVAIEIKVKGGRFLPHQAIALRMVQNGVFSHKFPDMGRLNPFDGVILKGADAFEVWCDKGVCIAYGYDGQEFTFELSPT